MQPLRLAAVLFASALCAGGMHAAEPPATFDLSVPSAPQVGRVDGRILLRYELHLASFALQPLEPLQVEVLDADRVLARFDGPHLEARLDRTGLQVQHGDGGGIAPGRRGIVFIDLILAEGTPLPATLRHRLQVASIAAGDAPATYRIEGGATAVAPEAGAVLGAPLVDGPWVAVADPGWTRGHRRVAYALHGRVRTPGRHAVDWVRVDAGGRSLRDDSGLASSAFGYGAPVLAVADGVVVGLRDDVDERRRLDETLSPERRRHDASGNAIVIALDDGRFAHYAHLRPGSLRVAQGQRVRRGERIGEVGFSGSASHPQLHLAITDGAQELASEGLPYRLAAFSVLGRHADPAAAGGGPWDASGAIGSRRDEMPGAGTVLRFAPQQQWSDGR